MFYRQCGIRHTTYQADRRLVPIPGDRWLAAAVVIAAVTAPLWVERLYLSSYLTPWVIWSTATLSLNLLMGWAGQIHLGFASVMAIGAYASVHMARLGVPFVLAFAAGGVVAALVGSLFGVPAARVRGLYLAITTLALQYVVDWVIIHVPAISGGAQTTLQVPPMRVGTLTLDSDAARYYVALAWCALVTLFTLNLRRTGLGRALVAVREKDYAAEVIGVNVRYYKSLAFWLSSLLAGVTGAVLAFAYYRAVTPEQFSLNVSIQVVAMVIVGGVGSVIGSFLGAGFVLLGPIVLNRLVASAVQVAKLWVPAELLAHVPLVLYGTLIVLFLLVEPLGLAKIYDNVRNYFLVWPFGYTRRQAA